MFIKTNEKSKTEGEIFTENDHYKEAINQNYYQHLFSKNGRNVVLDRKCYSH